MIAGRDHIDIAVIVARIGIDGIDQELVDRVDAGGQRGAFDGAGIALGQPIGIAILWPRRAELVETGAQAGRITARLIRGNATVHGRRTEHRLAIPDQAGRLVGQRLQQGITGRDVPGAGQWRALDQILDQIGLDHHQRRRPGNHADAAIGVIAVGQYRVVDADGAAAIGDSVEGRGREVRERAVAHGQGGRAISIDAAGCGGADKGRRAVDQTVFDQQSAALGGIDGLCHRRVVANAADAALPQAGAARTGGEDGSAIGTGAIAHEVGQQDFERAGIGHGRAVAGVVVRKAHAIHLDLCRCRQHSQRAAIGSGHAGGLAIAQLQAAQFHGHTLGDVEDAVIGRRFYDRQATGVGRRTEADSGNDHRRGDVEIAIFGTTHAAQRQRDGDIQRQHDGVLARRCIGLHDGCAQGALIAEHTRVGVAIGQTGIRIWQIHIEGVDHVGGGVGLACANTSQHDKGKKDGASRPESSTHESAPRLHWGLPVSTQGEA